MLGKPEITLVAAVLALLLIIRAVQYYKDQASLGERPASEIIQEVKFKPRRPVLKPD